MNLAHRLLACTFLVSVALPNPSSAAPGLTQVAQFDHEVTGVTVTPEGRRFVNFPRWSDDAPDPTLP